MNNHQHHHSIILLLCFIWSKWNYLYYETIWTILTVRKIENLSLKWFICYKNLLCNNSTKQGVGRKEAFSIGIFWPWDQREMSRSKRHNRTCQEQLKDIPLITGTFFTHITGQMGFANWPSLVIWDLASPSCVADLFQGLLIPLRSVSQQAKIKSEDITSDALWLDLVMVYTTFTHIHLDRIRQIAWPNCKREQEI